LSKRSKGNREKFAGVGKSKRGTKKEFMERLNKNI